ncbi:MAG: hypothetical protein ACR2Q4_20650, partial [Geminicoccaceae bacterium]
MTTWATFVSFGLILFLFGSRMHADLIDPGQVYTGHAEIESCADCHVSFEAGPAGWLKAAFAPANPIADSDKCLACHKWGDASLNAHNLPRPELVELTAKFQEADLSFTPWTVEVSRAVFPLPQETHNGTLACGACHKEHEGEDSNLVEVANARCQT